MAPTKKRPASNMHDAGRSPAEYVYGVHFLGRDFYIWCASDLEAKGEALGVEDKHAPAQLVRLPLSAVQRTESYFYRGERHTPEQAASDGMLDHA